MGISVDLFRNLIVRPTLELLGEYSNAAEKLLVGTAVCESGLSTKEAHSDQHFGPYQLSAAEHRGVWEEFLINHSELEGRVRQLTGKRSHAIPPDSELQRNYLYATAVAWFHYRLKGVYRLADDDAALAICWSTAYRRHGSHHNAAYFLQALSDIEAGVELELAA